LGGAALVLALVVALVAEAGLAVFVFAGVLDDGDVADGRAEAPGSGFGAVLGALLGGRARLVSPAPCAAAPHAAVRRATSAIDNTGPNGPSFFIESGGWAIRGAIGM
jgi:hypothetical protein